MPTQFDGNPKNPTSPRSKIGERVHIDEVVGNTNGPISLPDLADVADNVTPGKGSILAGDGSVYQEFEAGPDGYVIVYDSSKPEGLDRVPFGGGGGGITAGVHQTLRQLIHFIDEGPGSGFPSGAYKEVIGGVFPTSITWYDDATKAKKLVEKLITRSGGGATNVAPTPVVWKMYTFDGVTVVGQISDSIVYSGAFEINRTRTVVL